MKGKGWICLYRKIKSWGWYHNLNTRITFIHCLLSANYEDSYFEKLKIPRGSFVTSREKLAKEVGISIQQLRTSLKNLESTNELTIKTTKKFTIITIVNYDLYQDVNQVSNQQLTNNQPTTNQQLTTIEQYNNKTINNNNTTTTTIGEKSLFEFVESVFGRPLGSFEMEVVASWEDNDLTRYAIKQSELSRTLNVRYISRILYSFQSEGIKTVAEAEEREIKFQKNKNIKKQSSRPVYKSKAEREEEAVQEFLREHGVEEND